MNARPACHGSGEQILTASFCLQFLPKGLLPYLFCLFACPRHWLVTLYFRRTRKSPCYCIVTTWLRLVTKCLCIFVIHDRTVSWTRFKISDPFEILCSPRMIGENFQHSLTHSDMTLPQILALCTADLQNLQDCDLVSSNFENVAKSLKY